MLVEGKIAKEEVAENVNFYSSYKDAYSSD